RFALIDGALTKNIRAVIFISDYMKHRNDPKIYVHPIFETTWKAIRNKYSDIFWIVTSPPPAHREHILKTGDQAMLGTRASLLMSKDGALKRHVAGEYEANVQRLAEAMRVHEACEILEPAIV
ncbi:MAG: hypothetical protein ACJ8LM_03810, partial [Candidatus Udaeobacter sp.]